MFGSSQAQACARRFRRVAWLPSRRPLSDWRTPTPTARVYPINTLRANAVVASSLVRGQSMTRSPILGWMSRVDAKATSLSAAWARYTQPTAHRTPSRSCSHARTALEPLESTSDSPAAALATPGGAGALKEGELVLLGLSTGSVVAALPCIRDNPPSNLFWIERVAVRPLSRAGEEVSCPLEGHV